jgi:MFS family permease
MLLVIYLLNATWNLTDHDDGHTLGYHAMGRNEAIQRAYGAYDSMCDFLLGLLPANYTWLMGAMVGGTILASFAILYFSGTLLKRWFALNNSEIAIAQLLFLVSMPEFLYMGFSFKSVYISLAIILASASLQFNNISSKANLFFAAMLFGLGVSFRWNMLMMGAPLVAMFCWELKGKENWSITIFYSLFWGILAILSSLFFVYLSGYPPDRIVKTYLWGKEYAEKTDFQLIARIGDLSLFFTPATALSFVLAFLFLIKQKGHSIKFAVLFSITFIAVAAISFAPSFKLIAPLWISFIALFAFAVKYYLTSSPVSRKIQAGFILSAIAINWFIGIQINTPSSNWGPGLSAKDSLEDMSIFSKNLGTDNRFKFSNVKVGFVDGFALPTSEGYRPLYGHAYALLFGKLKQLDEKLNMESEQVLKRAANTNSIIYQDRINPYLLASYLRNGYQTNQPWNPPLPFVKRTLHNNADTVTELRISNPKELFELDSFVQVTHQYDSVFLMFTFTSACNKFLYDINQNYGYGYIKLGPMSAVIWPQKNKMK